jgi:hypothetical protein
MNEEIILPTPPHQSINQSINQSPPPQKQNTPQGVHSLLLHARNLPLLEALAPRLRSLSCLVIQGCRPLRCLGLDTPVTPRDDELLVRVERVLAVCVLDLGVHEWLGDFEWMNE